MLEGLGGLILDASIIDQVKVRRGKGRRGMRTREHMRWKYDRDFFFNCIKNF